ncbi:MAG: hypothetical protein BEN19_06895 [Epulopiscium sp. Nuni2H_MBin003]|nr:MAG: hypothetical protein BEN19_06895 [Epulopiscium sp. Nuni2H_MBin003]
MYEYNLIAEYTALMVLATVLISFFRDYEVRTLRYMFIKALYTITFISIVCTIVSTEMTAGSLRFGNLHIAYLLNGLYFISVPLVSALLMLYARVLADSTKGELTSIKQLLPTCIPFILYVIFVIIATPHNLIFSITMEHGYRRELLYFATFVIVSIYLVMMLTLMLKNLKEKNQEVVNVLMTTIGCWACLIIIQILVPEIVFTGIGNTMAVLIVHLYVQNVSKSSDPLTRTLNRIYLTQTLNDNIRKKKDFSFYVFSLRNFKMVNERYGLEIGDKVLMEVSAMLLEHFEFDNVFRYGGDEFAVLVYENSQEYDIKISKVLEKFRTSMSIYSHEVFIDIIYTRIDYPQFGHTVKDLISAADCSIKKLKDDTSGLDYLYDFSVVGEMIDKHNMVEKIKKSLDDDGLVVHYQPIYSAEQKCFVQAEALVRMKGDEGKLIFPGDFIELAETTGLIVRLTYRVLEIVCRDLRQLIDSNEKPENFDSVSINFPYLQFSSPEMIEKVMIILEKYDIEPSRIKIEITERMLISDSASIKNSIQVMMEKGFVFELDDFGIDYSNLSVLLDLPLNIIKIDRSLLLSALKNPENLKFFEHLIGGMKIINRKVLIEGIEEKEQLDFCVHAGGDLFQGYHFSRPIPFEQLKQIIK